MDDLDDKIISEFGKLTLENKVKVVAQVVEMISAPKQKQKEVPKCQTKK